MTRKLISYLACILLSISVCSAQSQPIEYAYSFEKKLRYNLDQIILKGVEDTCGIIPFSYIIEIKDEEEIRLNFQAENDCSATIDFKALFAKGDVVEVIIDDKHQTLVDGNETEKNAVAAAVIQSMESFQEKKVDPIIMLRVDRGVKNRKKVDEILKEVHVGYLSLNMDFPLVFDLGKSSRAEPPRLEILFEDSKE
ncbi:MAG: hypothetical protein AAF487_02575 [Bacteroidota bacterium]